MSETAIHPDDLALYAINTGSLYQTHVEMARRSAFGHEWDHHVRFTVLPLYRREINDRRALASAVDVAEYLRRYYAQHLADNGERPQSS